MSDNSPNLQLPYLMPDQAQKHVTHNEALQRIDAVSQLVLSGFLSSPPPSPAEGACYGVLAPGGGAWQGHAGDIACLMDGDWIFLTPKAGWQGWSGTTGEMIYFDGTNWQTLIRPFQDMFGVGAAPDATNRLTVSSAASLFNHRGAGHQMKVNRADDAATASLLFQTGFSGRAEIGLLGNTNFGLKVSPDGATWKNAIQVSPRGVVNMPARPICRTHLNPVTNSLPNPAFTGFQSFSLNQGEFTLGASVLGVGQKLVIPATGLYRATVTVLALSSSGHSVAIMYNDGTSLVYGRSNANFVNVLQSFSAIASMNAGDTLALQHTGTAQLQFGPGRTEMTVELL